MITEWIHQVLHYVELHPHFGMIFAFLVSFIESLPVIGTIFPGSITMTAVGTLIGAKALPAVPTLAFACFGAFLGDVIGYYTGKYGDNWIRNTWPFNKHHKWLTKGENFFHKHGGKSVVIGRFVGPVRSTMPLIAGILRMPTSRFFAAAIPSAILWAIAYTVPGILLGALSMDVSPHSATKFLIVGVIAIVLFWLLFWLAFRCSRYIANSINRAVDALWRFSSKHKHGIVHVIARQDEPSDHKQMLLFVFAVIAFISFIIDAIQVLTHSGWYHANQPLMLFLQSIHTPLLTHTIIWFTLLGDKVVIFGIAVIMMLWLYLQKQQRSFWHLFALTFSIGFIVSVLKLIYHSPRPDIVAHVASSSSFPSGHTSFVTAIFGFLCFLCTRHCHKRWHSVFYCLMVFVPLLTGFSRVYFAAHWLTDIIASWSLGTMVLLLVILSYRRDQHLDEVNKNWLWATACIVFVPLLCYGSWQYQKTLADYQPIHLTQIAQVQSWWQQPLHFIPAFRNNRFGKPTTPINVQWLGNLDNIKKQLSNQGFVYVSDTLDLKTTVKRLANDHAANHLPVVNRLYLGKKPVALFYKATKDNKRIVMLQLWVSNVDFLDSNAKLYAGTIEYQLSLPIKLLDYSEQRHTFAPNNELQLLQSLPSIKRYRRFCISDNNWPEKIKKQQWNGCIILLDS